MTENHSPTPWKAIVINPLKINNQDLAAVSDANAYHLGSFKTADAAHIVTCVNSHDALVGINQAHNDLIAEADHIRALFSSGLIGNKGFSDGGGVDYRYDWERFAKTIERSIAVSRAALALAKEKP